MLLESSCGSSQTASAASTPLTKTVLTVFSIALAYLLITYVHVVIGEVVPKNVGIDKRDRLAVAG